MKEHFVSQNISLLEALERINSIAPDPLVLFVMDADNRMVGTLTDGDSRRALIAGRSVNDTVDKVMHRNFNYMRVEDIMNVQEIRRHRLFLSRCSSGCRTDRALSPVPHIRHHRGIPL